MLSRRERRQLVHEPLPEEPACDRGHLHDALFLCRQPVDAVSQHVQDSLRHVHCLDRLGDRHAAGVPYEDTAVQQCADYRLDEERIALSLPYDRLERVLRAIETGRQRADKRLARRIVELREGDPRVSIV